MRSSLHSLNKHFTDDVWTKKELRRMQSRTWCIEQFFHLLVGSLGRITAIQFRKIPQFFNNHEIYNLLVARKCWLCNFAGKVAQASMQHAKEESEGRRIGQRIEVVQ